MVDYVFKYFEPNKNSTKIAGCSGPSLHESSRIQSSEDVVASAVGLHLPWWSEQALTLSDAGVWKTYLGRGEAPKAPLPFRGTFSTPDPKNGSQPQNSPRQRCYNIKRTQKLHATCCNCQLFVLRIFPSYCSRQGPPL